MYHENKISLEENIIDYNIYKKVNILENLNYTFKMDKFSIQNKLFYNITHNQCACDFFNSKNIKLQEEFVKFILTRMKISCVEPCIYIRWTDNDEVTNNIPNNIININDNELLNIFTTKYKEACFCIKRTNKNNMCYCD